MTISEQRETVEQITIPDNSSPIPIAIEQKEVIVEHKTLGCFKSITGISTQEIQYLKMNSDILGNRILRANLTNYQISLSYNIVFLPSLKYGLPSISLSFKKIEDIHRYAVDKILSRMGYDCSTSRALLYGPAEFGGFGIRHLYTEMMGMKLDTVVSHLRADTQLGKAFRINLNYLQLTAGITEPILESSTPLVYIDNNWILHLRQFLNEINGKLEIQDIWLPKHHSSHDISIMTAFMAQHPTKAELRTLNNWRIYYRVIFYSEICFPSGKSIQPMYLNSTMTLLKRNPTV
jgi:hypothetical protein